MTMTATSGDSDIDNLAIIDEAHIASFSDGDDALESELGDLFLKTALGYLKRMKEACREERAWSAEAHALKGASANLGARRVAALARQAEFSPPSSTQIEAIEAAIDEVRAFFANRTP